MKTRKRLFLFIICLCLSLGMFFGFSLSFKNKKVAYAEAYPIETETGVTLNKSGTYKVSITPIENWRTKGVQFDIKGEGAIQVVFRDSHNENSGIIRTTPDRSPEGPDMISYEPINHQPAYWKKDDMSSVPLGDGWYRWTFDLSKLHSDKLNGSETLTLFYLLSATGDVQVKNLKSFDCNHFVTIKDAFGVLHEPIENWKQHAIMFEAYIPDTNKRRFTVCKESGSVLSGIVVLKKDSLSYENPDYVEGVNDYWTVDPIKPLALGDNWYQFVLDMSKLKMQPNRNGYETVDRIKDFTETSGLFLEIRNLRVVPDNYDMVWVLGGDNDELVWGDTNGYVSDWVNANKIIKFDYFGLPNGNFSFGFTPTDRVTEKFTFAADGKLMKGSTEVGTYADSLSGNGWKSVVLDLNALGPNGSATSDIKYLRCDGGSVLYVKDFVSQKLYSPSDDADMVWHLGGDNDELVWNETNGYISNWKGRDCVVTFDFYGNPNGNFSFANTFDGRTTAKFKFEANGKILSGTTEVGTYAESSFGNGWMSATLSLEKLYENKFDEIKYLRCDGTGDLYVRSFAHTNNYDPLEDAEIVLEKNKYTAIPDVPIWQSSVISFEIYHGTLDLTIDPQFIFGEKGTEANVSSYFGYKDIGGLGLQLRTSGSEGYWVKATTQPESVGDGWYKWTINLSELKAIENGRGGETIGSIYNRGGMDAYIRNFKVESTTVPTGEGVIKLTAGENTAIPDVVHWSKSVISFEFYNPTLDRNSDPQFQFVEKETQNTTISGFFGYAKGNISTFIVQNPEGDPYWKNLGSQPEAVGNGWYKVTIDLSDLKPIQGNEAKTIGFLKNRGAYDVYIRNFTIVSVTHNPDDAVNENIVNATCLEDGSHDEVVYCKDCHAELSRDSKTDTKLGHDIVSHEAQNPGCESIGWGAYDTCSRCDYTTYKEISATGHTNGEVQIEKVVEPNCTTDGSHDEVIYCTVCTKEVSRETKVDTKLGHDLIDDAAIAAKCLEDGKEAGKHCSRCEYTEGGAKIDALGHSYGDPVFSEWTATDSGYTIGATQECSRCHDIKNLTPTVTSESLTASCIVKGDITYKASVTIDGTVYNAQDKIVEGEFAPHAWDKGTVTKEATCTEKGVKTFVCTVNGCTETKTEEIAALGHNAVKHDAVEATCVADGNIEYYTCDRCNKKFSDSNLTTEVSDVTVKGGHNLAKVNAKNPICDVQGNIEHNHCSVCGKNFDNNGAEIENVTVDALGHKYDNRGKCEVCGFEGPNYRPVLPQVTGCESAISISGIVFVAAICAIAIKRKKENL